MDLFIKKSSVTIKARNAKEARIEANKFFENNKLVNSKIRRIRKNNFVGLFWALYYTVYFTYMDVFGA